MAVTSTTEVFQCTPEQFFSIVSDYEKYPEFLSEVKKCKVIDTKDNKKLVEYQVSMIKSFAYRLWITENPGKKIEWTFESGDIFKTLTGSWEIADLLGKTQAKYSVDATFKIFVPGPVAKALVKTNLPNMMKAYHNRIQAKYG